MKPYVVDADDFHSGNHNLELLCKLKRTHPNFKITLFSVPAFCPQSFIRTVGADWMSFVPHGWSHPTPRECEHWGYNESINYLEFIEVSFPFMERGFKAPGWQISDGMYQALLEKDYWVADQAYNNHRRPKELRKYILTEDEDRYIKLHYHIQNVCGNGLQERFDELMAIPEDAEFNFIKDII